MATHFQKELNKLKKRILALGATVEDRVRAASQSVEKRELFDVKRIIKSDYEIDDEEVEIEEECLKILALYQPVAVDLRFLIAIIKINSELERIADEAVNIARCTQNLIKKQNKSSIIYDYSSMIEKSQAMLTKSLDSLVNLDIDEAFKVLLLDDEVDREYDSMYEMFKKDLKSAPDSVEYLTNMFLIARHLERVADHATNIAEEVIYMIEGAIVRHGKY